MPLLPVTSIFVLSGLKCFLCLLDWAMVTLIQFINSVMGVWLCQLGSRCLNNGGVVYVLKVILEKYPYHIV